MMYKKLLKAVLALAMVIPTIAAPVKVSAATNLALNKTAVASSVEANSVRAALATDGDNSSRSSRWGSDMGSGPHWIYVDLGAATDIKAVKIFWENRKATSYAIEVSNDASSWETVVLFDDRPQTINDVINFSEVKNARYVRLYIHSNTSVDPDGGTEWNTVSIYELEVYGETILPPSNEILETDTAKEAAAKLKDAPTLNEEGTAIVVPQLPEGFEVEVLADYEEIVNKDGTIYQPLTDKTVKVLYKVIKDGESAEASSEYPLVIKGLYEDAGINAKPTVIPELAEWYGHEGHFTVTKDTRIVVDEDAEFAMFAAQQLQIDYKAETGIELKVVTGEAKAGDIYFTYEKDKHLGEEGYVLDAGDILNVEAEEKTGAYWATRSILQILELNNNTMPKGVARDYPRYEIRSFSLDVARKPFELSTLYAIVKEMAYYKMNDFQVHLNDNLIFYENFASVEEAMQKAYVGFRLESDIKKGGVIAGDSKGVENAADLTSKDLFYTKKEFREFILAARELGVEIVPEFDAPGHAGALINVRPDLRLKVNTEGRPNRRGEQFDLSDECYADSSNFVKQLWNEYLKEDMFDSSMTVHIGTDEYYGDAEAFRKFSDDILAHVQQTNQTVRMWGSLSHKRGTTPVRSENVQLNIWNTGYADPKTMYNEGYDLINTNEGPLYVVPAAGYYNDYLNARNIYNNFNVNVFGSTNIPSASEQVIGATYAIWNDSIDTQANGISEVDAYDRFLKPLPAFAAKVWGVPNEMSFEELSEAQNELGEAPGNNAYSKESSINDEYAKYEFENDKETEDSTANNRDLTDNSNVSFENGQLVLNGDESYVETPFTKLATGNKLEFDITLDKEPTPGDIIFEASNTGNELYSHDIRIMDDGTLGYTRELYDYSFGYTLPVNETKHITIINKGIKATLVVDGEEYIGIGKYVDAAGETKNENIIPGQRITKGGNGVGTFLLPLERIGSKTNAIEATIDNVYVTQLPDASKADKDIDPSTMSVTSGSFQPNNETEGDPNFVLDGDAGTIWHSLWAGTPRDTHWLEFTFDEVTTIDGMRFMQRSGNNGNVKKFDLYVRASENDEWSKVVSEGTLDSDQAWQLVSFDAVEAKQVKFQVLEAGDNGNGILFAAAAEVRFTAVKEEPVNKDALNAKVAEVENTKADAYTKESYDAFKAALDTAKAVLADEQASQDKVDTALATLQDAYKALVKKPVEKPFPFTDVSNKQWYYGVINEAYQLGLMTGASDSLFKPNANMNRGMVAIVFHRMEGSKKVEYSKVFPDVANKQYYTTSVLWAKQTGVINGYKDGTFKPLRNVSREEMATMIYNFARYKGLDMSASKDITYFSDYAKITPYARVTLQWAVEKGLMSGKDNGTRLDPLGTATRAECSKMLVQAYKVIYK